MSIFITFYLFSQLFLLLNHYTIKRSSNSVMCSYWKIIQTPPIIIVGGGFTLGGYFYSSKNPGMERAISRVFLASSGWYLPRDGVASGLTSSLFSVSKNTLPSAT